MQTKRKKRKTFKGKEVQNGARVEGEKEGVKEDVRKLGGFPKGNLGWRTGRIMLVRKGGSRHVARGVKSCDPPLQVLGWLCSSHFAIQWTTTTSASGQRPHVGDSDQQKLHRPLLLPGNQQQGRVRGGLWVDWAVLCWVRGGLGVRRRGS